MMRLRVSPVRRAVSYDFRVTSDDHALGEWFDHLLGALPVIEEGESGTACAEWTITCVTDVDPHEWRFLVDDEARGRSLHPEQLVTTMVQALNGQVVQRWPGTVCHAGCVAVGGDAILLPADPEAGKTTLTCGLVRAGFEYVTDEGVAFVPGTARIEPYPKPISLDRGSWFLFPELEPHPTLAAGEGERSQWQVAPDDVRPGAASGPCEAKFLVFPQYVDGAATALLPLSRSEALVELAKNTFEFNQRSRQAIEQLERVVRACDCHRLTVGTLDDAVACIEELVAHA
jgi:hypothetical protein